MQLETRPPSFTQLCAALLWGAGTGLGVCPLAPKIPIHHNSRRARNHLLKNKPPTQER